MRIGLELDEEIAATVVRIKARKQQIAGAAQILRAAARHQLTAPSTLLLAVGVGFVVGRVTERARAPGQSRLRRIWNTISESAEAALGVMQAPSLRWLLQLFGRSSGSASAQDAGDRPISASSLNIPIV